MRLKIRVNLGPESPPPVPARRRPNKGLLLILSVVAAVLLIWLGIRAFRTGSPPAPVTNEGTVGPQVQSSPQSVPDEPSREVTETSQPAIETAENREPADSSPSTQVSASPMPVHEVIPDAPRSALQTIRGTVRVTVRVIIEKDGSVLAATADDPGPSRYFERLSLEAAKNWRFTPAPSDGQRIAIVKFSFTRFGASAQATPAQ
jgi:TonB family protein